MIIQGFDNALWRAAFADEEELKHAIASQGPCSIAIDASHESFQFYSAGVYREPECDPGNLDHGVLLIFVWPL